MTRDIPLSDQAEAELVAETPFYIPATGTMTRPRVTLKYGDTFAVLDRHGDIDTLVGIWAYNAHAIVEVVKDRGLRDKTTVVVFDAAGTPHSRELRPSR